jgi:hypothetical protein
MLRILFISATLLSLGCGNYHHDKNAGMPAPPKDLGAPSGPIAFETVKAEIFQPCCIRCHSSLVQYANVKARLSSIQSSIESDAMPKGGPSLRLDLKVLLENWIAQGSPESLERTLP